MYSNIEYIAARMTVLNTRSDNALNSQDRACCRMVYKMKADAIAPNGINCFVYGQPLIYNYSKFLLA